MIDWGYNILIFLLIVGYIPAIIFAFRVGYKKGINVITSRLSKPEAIRVLNKLDEEQSTKPSHV